MSALRAFFLLLFCAFGVVRAEPMRFVYPPPEAAGDERHAYYWQLLEAALAANRDQYGDYSVRAYALPMTFQRGVAEKKVAKENEVSAKPKGDPGSAVGYADFPRLACVARRFTGEKPEHHQSATVRGRNYDRCSSCPLCRRAAQGATGKRASTV